MTYDYKFSSQVCSTLKAIVGKRLDSYRLNSTDNSSFEIFVLRFPETDIEVATKEIVGIDEWFDETNTVEIADRPNRDSWSRLGKSEPDNGIPAGGFLDYPVGKVITGVSVISETFKHAEDSIEFVRGLIIHLGNESIVFDKGSHNWEYIWSVQVTANSSIVVSPAEFDSVEEPGLSSATTVTRLF